MNAIETSKLTKFYGAHRGIIDVDLQVKEGDFFGFIGPNGAGKSTTIRTLLSLISPTSGSANSSWQFSYRRTRQPLRAAMRWMPLAVEMARGMERHSLSHKTGIRGRLRLPAGRAIEHPPLFMH